MGNIYSTNYLVPFYHSDLKGDMAASAILNVALQVSGEQSAHLGRSEEWVMENYHYSWIVTEYEIDIKRLPKFLEEIVIETEAINYNKFFCYRDFRYKSKEGELLVNIHSTWVLMDSVSRKAGRVEEEIVKPYESEKINKIKRGHVFSKLENAKVKKYQIRYSDIDLNMHVNNSKYYEWAINPLGFDFLTHHRPKKIYIKYNHEILPGEQISSSVMLRDKISHHLINDNDAQIEIEWEKI